MTSSTARTCLDLNSTTALLTTHTLTNIPTPTPRPRTCRPCMDILAITSDAWASMRTMRKREAAPEVVVTVSSRATTQIMNTTRMRRMHLALETGYIPTLRHRRRHVTRDTHRLECRRLRHHREPEVARNWRTTHVIRTNVISTHRSASHLLLTRTTCNNTTTIRLFTPTTPCTTPTTIRSRTRVRATQTRAILT